MLNAILRFKEFILLKPKRFVYKGCLLKQISFLLVVTRYIIIIKHHHIIRFYHWNSSFWYVYSKSKRLDKYNFASQIIRFLLKINTCKYTHCYLGSIEFSTSLQQQNLAVRKIWGWVVNKLEYKMNLIFCYQFRIIFSIVTSYLWWEVEWGEPLYSIQCQRCF